MIGQSFRVLYPTQGEYERTGERILAQPGYETAEYADERAMRRVDGELFWCHVWGHALDAADPHAAGIWSFEDLSSRRSLKLDFTAREREIAALLIEGLTSKLVGKRLGISPRTVDVYRGAVDAQGRRRPPRRSWCTSCWPVNRPLARLGTPLQVHRPPAPRGRWRRHGVRRSFSRPPLPSRHPSEIRMTVAGTKPTVCVIDDDPSTAEAVRSALAPIGFAVVSFDNDADFLLSGVARRCDCLIAVGGGKGLSTSQLQQTLRAAGLSLPVMLIAGSETGRPSGSPLPAGVSAVLRKPISPSTLLVALRRALASRR